MARRSFWAAPSRPVGARGSTGPQGITISDNNQYRVTAGYADDGLVTLENVTITKGTNIANEFSCGVVGIGYGDPQLMPLADNGGLTKTLAIPVRIARE